MLQTDVCIIGAGPGGAATALKLSYLGIPNVLVDKARFPRDKVCCDAISGKVSTMFNRLDPAIMQRFEALSGQQIDVWGIKFVAPNGKQIDVPFKVNYDKERDPVPGYVSKRVDFDHFLIGEVQRRENIRFFEGVAVEEYEKLPDGFLVRSADGDFELRCRMLIVANGAHSSFSRHYAGLAKDRRHHAGAVRAYFRNVSKMHDDNFIELHFLKEVNPGYFWIFPLPGGYANVGLGMRTDHLSRRGVNLRKTLESLIDTHPALKERFAGAERVGKVEGFGLPLGSKRRVISGDHYMLVGDAGHLIDPLTGEGIGNAVYSGFIAAEQAQQCLLHNQFSARYLRAYDKRVARVLGSEMKLSFQLQRMLRYIWLTNLLFNWVDRNRMLIDLISEMYSDFKLRRQLLNPVFWVKLLSGKVEWAKYRKTSDAAS